jgi:uncharacterized protein YaaN involved in tellurite resistance
MTDPADPTTNDQGQGPAQAGQPTGLAPVGQPITPALAPEERTRVDEIKQAVDVTDSQLVIQYGLPAQNKLSTFADALLSDVRTKNTGDAGEALSDLLVKVKELDVDGLTAGSAGARIPLIGRFLDAFKRFTVRYQKLSTNIDHLVNSLERARMALLKDITVLDKMYELNLEYLRQLDLYIAAGDEILEDLQTKKLPAMEVEARSAPDPLVAQQLTDFRNAVARFERRLHDLKLTRMIAIQTAPQVRLIQSNDQNLVEKIQSSILNTVPLWKNQIIIAISLYRQQQALELQKEVTDTANELLAKNAELLKTGSGKVAREVERGIVDLETLKKVNDDLIATLEETVRFQEEGHTKRVAAEGELVRMQAELKQRLIDLQARG